ncbi:MAG TPA: hypothetical protein VHU84_14510, partial [Lacipirellulaceae bacterium]|nr:hypothetical protein [Lacipirellulaceae bacterium]
MPTGSSQTLERLAWEGMIGGETALILGVTLAILTGWFLWREREIIGRGWALTFWLLRVAAFTCALWMLAGPTQLRTERTTANQSFAIFADGSESMDVIDQSDPADSARWAFAIDPTAKDSPLPHSDRLSVALGAAVANCEQFNSLVREHRDVPKLTASFETVNAMIDRAAKHAAATESSMSGADSSLIERLHRIAALLDGPIAESTKAIHTALASEGHAPVADFLTRSDQLMDSLTSAHRRSLAFAADLAQQQTQIKAISPSDADRLSRREKSARALDSLESQLSKQLASTINIERFRFDRTAEPVSVTAGWSKALAAAPATQATPTTARVTATSAPAEDQSNIGSATNISSVLEHLAARRAEHNLRMALLISDGRHNDPNAASPQEVAAQLTNLPVFVVPIGNSIPQRDLVLHRVEAPTTVAQKDSAVIDVIVTGFDCEGQKSAVVLKHNGEEVDRKPIEFTATHGDYRVRFNVAAKELGWQEYVVEAEPIADEVNTANNYQPVSFEVVRDRIRVLLADGVPRWEYRYLNQLFRRDPHVEFDELLFFPRLHGSGKLADKPAFPSDAETWAHYDVIILGDIGPQQLSADSQKGLDEFVRKRGGSLIVIAGQNEMPTGYVGQPLMDLLPVERANEVSPQQGYTLNVTEEGRFNSALLIADSADESQQAWESIYHRFPVFELSQYSKPKASARTLIEAVPEGATAVSNSSDHEVHEAFLCWQRVGAGRVGYLAAPDTYRLRWRLGDRMHHRFWGQFLRWINAASGGTGSDTVRLETDRVQYGLGDNVQVTVWLKDATGRPLGDEVVQAELKTFSGDISTVDLARDSEVPGRYFGTINKLAAGAYQIAVRGPNIAQLLPPGTDNTHAVATITVHGSDSVEMLNTQCNRALLEQIAQITGGQVIPPTALEEVLELVSF